MNCLVICRQSGASLNVIAASADETSFLQKSCSGGKIIELKIIQSDEVCVWSPDDEYDLWHGSCGAELVFDESSPYENEFKFCPSCGRTLTQFAPDKSGRLAVEGVDPQI